MTVHIKKKVAGGVTALHDLKGRRLFAVLPWSEYERLAALDHPADEEAADIAALDRAVAENARRAGAARAAGYNVAAYYPVEVVNPMIDGASAVKVWREYRELTQAELAKKIGVSRAYLTQIESRARAGTADVLARLARALGVLVDDLIEESALRRRRKS